MKYAKPISAYSTLKRLHAIKSIYQDDDGWWCELNTGWGWGTDDNGIVNGTTKEELYEALEDVHRLH